ncbi:MarR family winged helix-turn-helix transcriptional regulator [Carnobacterium mobile]|uniref:MarR family winged helix-turn-helix transcriptional regulator n=1 Tax=Carnobacterium mobile TaxID=2750 RepID=UPI00068FF0A1|nr:winged helix DNA-binding protein [Carnobacterium mobile]
MSDSNWKELGENIALLHSFSRKVLAQHYLLTITTNELDILTWIFFAKGKETPIKISQDLKLKKESVSRTLKSLIEKGLVKKELNNLDERSYYLAITEKGIATLEENYIYLMKPYYYLKRSMGDDYDLFIKQVAEADKSLTHFNNGGTSE